MVGWNCLSGVAQREMATDAPPAGGDWLVGARAWRRARIGSWAHRDGGPAATYGYAAARGKAASDQSLPMSSNITQCMTSRHGAPLCEVSSAARVGVRESRGPTVNPPRRQLPTRVQNGPLAILDTALSALYFRINICLVR